MSNGDQKGTKTEPEGCQNEEDTSKSNLCGTGMQQIGNGMRKGSQCMLKESHNEAKNDAQSHEQFKDKSSNEKLMNIMINADETMQKGNQKS